MSNQIKNSSQIIADVCDYITKNLEKNITHEQLAKCFFFSEHYLRHIFKRETGVSIGKFTTAQRLKKAKFLLETSDLKIIDIASACGFNNPSYFSKVFTKETGILPKDYRKNTLR